MKKDSFCRKIAANWRVMTLRSSIQAFGTTKNDYAYSLGYFGDFGQNNEFWPTVGWWHLKLGGSRFHEGLYNEKPLKTHHFVVRRLKIELAEFFYESEL